MKTIMKPLSTFEKEIKVHQEVLEFVPKDPNYRPKYLTLDQFLKTENYSSLWKQNQFWKKPVILDDFEIGYAGEDQNIYRLNNQQFRELLNSIDDFSPDIEKLSIEFVRLIKNIV